MGNFNETRKIARKYVKTVEVNGTGEIDLLPGQKILHTKVITEAVSPAPGWLRVRRAMPSHTTIIVLECTEWEGYDYGGSPS